LCLLVNQDWVHDMSGGGKSKGRAGGLFPVNVKSDSKSEAELRGQHVVVPPGAEAQTISCPICKEPLKSEFLEDDEEWVWRNAVKRDDKVWLHFYYKFLLLNKYYRYIMLHVMPKHSLLRVA